MTIYMSVEVVVCSRCIFTQTEGLRTTTATPEYHDLLDCYPQCKCVIIDGKHRLSKVDISIALAP